MKSHFINLEYRRVPHMLHVELRPDLAVHHAKLYRQCGNVPAYEPIHGSAFLAIGGRVLYEDENKTLPWKNRDLMAKITKEIAKVMVASGDESFKEAAEKPLKQRKVVTETSEAKP